MALTLSTDGVSAFAQAWTHLVREELFVTVMGGVAATSMVRISRGGDGAGRLGAMIAGGACRHNS
jgi:hypothetical protein